MLFRPETEWVRRHGTALGTVSKKHSRTSIQVKIDSTYFDNVIVKYCAPQTLIIKYWAPQTLIIKYWAPQTLILSLSGTRFHKPNLKVCISQASRQVGPG